MTQLSKMLLARLSLAFALISVVGLTILTAQAEPAKGAGFDQSHSDWTAVLQKYTVQNNGSTQVKYSELHKNSSQLNKYLKLLGKVNKKTYDQFSESEKLAFWINAYNAFTLKLVVDYYPVKSIKKVGAPSNPWKLKFITLLGKNMNLEQIERDTLQKQFDDPRYHFALNSAALGYPSLRGEAYTGENLDSQLNDQVKVFLRDSERNQIDTVNKTLKLAQFMADNKDDLAKKDGSLQKFIAPFITDDDLVKTALKNDEFAITYNEFNWDLNNVTN